MNDKDGKKENDIEISDVVPQLVVTHQGRVAEEHFSQNGITKEVHVVVKNLVFLIEAVSTVDLNNPKCNLEAKLLYDFDREEDAKLEVSYVKNEPMEYKVVVSENGYKATVELRIKVLTSQHEDMLFRVRLQAIDPVTQMQFGTFSQPIKVISKLNQLKKSKDSMSPAAVQQQQQKKRVTNDTISAMLLQLNQQVQRQQKCIELIMGKLMLEAPPQVLSLSSSSSSIPDPLETLQIASTMNSEMDIDSSFQSFMIAYAGLPSEEKKTKLLQMLSSVASEQLTDIYEVLESLPAAKKLKTN